jgi:hypothetical protein
VAISGPSTLAVDRAVAGQVTTRGVTPTVFVMIEPTSATLESNTGSRRGLLGVSDDAQPLSLAGLPALAVQSAERDLLTREVICVRHGRAYVIDFTAHHDSFAADAAALEQIVNGWSWV